MGFLSRLFGKKDVSKGTSQARKLTQSAKNKAYPENYFSVDTGEAQGIPAQLTMPAPMQDEVLQEVREKIQQAPHLPSVWGEIQQAIGRGDSAKEVAKIVRNDPALATKVLKAANSVGFGGTREISDIGQAVVRLGFQAVRGIATSYSTTGFSKQWKSPFSIQALWKHAMAVSTLSEVTARHIAGCDRGVASTLGLLHDIGRMGLNSICSTPFRLQADTEAGFLAYEQEHFACTHIEAGVLLAEHWGLPEVLQHGIRYHHHPALGKPEDIPDEVRQEVLAVYLADYLAIHFGFSGGNPHVVQPDLSFAPLLDQCLNDIAHEPAVSKELWRIQVIDF